MNNSINSIRKKSPIISGIFVMMLLFCNVCFGSDARIDHLIATNDAVFLVADKTNGEILLINPVTGSIDRSPALYGRRIADSFDFNRYDLELRTAPFITPSGEFVITKAYSTRLKKNIFIFMHGTNMLMAIHSVYLGAPRQQRLERLQTPTPSDNRITNGCINVPDEFWHRIEDLPNGTKLYILPEMTR